MSKEDDELLKSIVDQVNVALDALNLSASRDDLIDGVRDALRSLSDVDVELQAESSSDQGPDVVVLDGGGASSEADERPDLRVVGAEDSKDESRPGASVRVHVVKPRPRRAVPSRGLREGSISVQEGEWQTVYRGKRPVPYRILCESGRLELALDGESVEQLQPGQSVDLDGELIRVRGHSAAVALYLRLG